MSVELVDRPFVVHVLETIMVIIDVIIDCVVETTGRPAGAGAGASIASATLCVVAVVVVVFFPRRLRRYLEDLAPGNRLRKQKSRQELIGLFGEGGTAN